MTTSFDGLPGILPATGNQFLPGIGLPGLEEARQVQHCLFPRELPQVPGWDVVAAWRPARVVSGDYYDLFEVKPGLLAVALGDVAGKGLGPALVMAGLRALVRSRLPGRTGDLSGLMREVNEYLLASTPDETFVTLFLAVLEVATGRLRYVNAGHLAPLVLAGSAAAEPMLLMGGGPVLGVFPGVEFAEEQACLRPGSLLALFSDGVTEAMDGQGRMFHQRRVVEALRSGQDGPAARTLERLLRAVDVFRGRREPADDVSVILLRRLP
jgi:serine phosphatase RsbU (regulator of sigma subunit)